MQNYCKNLSQYFHFCYSFRKSWKQSILSCLSKLPLMYVGKSIFCYKDHSSIQIMSLILTLVLGQRTMYRKGRLYFCKEVRVLCMHWSQKLIGGKLSESKPVIHIKLNNGNVSSSFCFSINIDSHWISALEDFIALHHI